MSPDCFVVYRPTLSTRIKLPRRVVKGIVSTTILTGNQLHHLLLGVLNPFLTCVTALFLSRVVAVYDNDDGL